RPVTIGFTSGIAVIIFSGQLENFLGLENIEKKQYFHQNMLEIIQHLPSVNVYSILIAILGVLLVIFIPRVFPPVPVLLVPLIVTVLFSSLFSPGLVSTIGSSFGGIFTAVPNFDAPYITLKILIFLCHPSFAIAMLSVIESLSSAIVQEGMTGNQHKSNKYL